MRRRVFLKNSTAATAATAFSAISLDALARPRWQKPPKPTPTPTTSPTPTATPTPSPTPSAGIVLNVLNYGAIKDGSGDNWNPIRSALTDLAAKGGGTLLFPLGVYRIGRGAGRDVNSGAIQIRDLNHIKIHFEPGAVLQMDNLSSEGLGDQGHGVLVEGNCQDITLENVKVVWKTLPSQRSQGDGIRFLGSVVATACPRGLKIINCQVERSPQAGVVIMGCKDIEVRQLVLRDTLADGLHFNACHGGIVADDIKGYNVGDDVCAFVTYYHPTDPGTGPFNSPTLTARNNNGARVTRIYAEGGIANAVRIAGGYDIMIDGITSVNKPRALIIDSARANGTTVGWSYLASRLIRVSNIDSSGGQSAIHIETFNCTYSDGDAFMVFDVIINGVTVRNATNDNVFITDCKGVALLNLKSFDGRVRIIGARDFRGEAWDIQRGHCLIFGSPDFYAGNLDVAMPFHNVVLKTIKVTSGWVLFQDLRGLTATNISSYHGPIDGVLFARVLDANVTGLIVQYPNRMKSTQIVRALLLDRCSRVKVSNYDLQHDQAPIRSIEVGGGDSIYVPRDITISPATYVNQINQTDADVAIQGGDYAPINCHINMNYYNGGESNPIWRQYVL